MKISLTGKENVYEQIVNEYKRYIEMNVYRYDEKLPTCRDLAKQLGVNPNTVSKAYTKLEELGYIKAIPKKGVYVTYQTNENNNNKIKKTIIDLKEEIDYESLIKIINDVYGK
jgi:GntR family transcriptional regulator